MDTPDRQALRDQIIENALSLESADRASYLNIACENNAELKREIERLLRLAGHLDTDFLEAPPSVKPPVARRIGRYRIEQEIGSGGAGRVYRAVDTEIQRTVALKILNPAGFASSDQTRARFLRELRLLGAINHENIVHLYDFGEHEGQLYLLMEYLPGEDLSKAITANRCGDLAAKLDIGRQIIAGLAHIHQAGIIHRDLKPANIFLLPTGRVKLMDFGIAHAAGLNLTATGQIAGTPAYMAPEQIEGKPATPLTDVHSLGVTLFELLSGERAFHGENIAKIFNNVLNTPLRLEPLRRNGVPDPVIRFIERCTAKDPTLRPSQIQQDYEFALKGLQPTPSYPVASRRRAIYAGGGALALASVAGTAYWTSHLRNSSAAVRSLAVLPFLNSTGETRYDYVAYGLTEGLISSLGYIKGLTVIARSAVLAYQNKVVDPREAGKRLGVDAIVTGTVSRNAEKFIVTAELADARTAAHLWSTTNQLKETELAAAHGTIAQTLAASLGLHPTPKARDTFQRQTENSDAYQNYLYGRYSFNKRTLTGYRQAVDYFQKAVDADPAFSQAWSGLADAYAFQGGLRPPKEVFPLAKQAVERSLQANPNLAEAHASAGFIHLQYDWDWPAAEREFRAALALNENDSAARTRYARLLLVLGRFDQAEQQLLRVRTLDPISLTTGATLANCYYLNRQYDRALQQIKKVLELEPGFMVAADLKADILVELRQFREAISIYEKEIADQPDDAGALASLVRAAILAGDRTATQTALDRFHKLAASKPINPSASAIVQLAQGKHDAAIAQLQEGFRQRYWPLIFLKVSPLWDPLRRRPAFDNLLRAMNLA